MNELYDRIGTDYAQYRRPDPRIAAPILRALGECGTVVNVGAGTGSYEPVDRRVVAIEPSRTMIQQRRPGAAPAVQANADALPLRDAAFDAALAVLTIHHWTNRARAFDELARSARRRVVLLTWDPDAEPFWLARDYLTETADLDRDIFPSMSELARIFGHIEVETVPIPHDCSDGFMCAYWRRPSAYLDAGARHAISTFAKVPHADRGLAHLEDDLRSGEWQRRYHHLLDLAELDCGYRLVTVQVH